MDPPSAHEKMLRLKIASELVLGNQASVAFSRAFYLEDLLIERILSECNELSHTCQSVLDRVKRFTEEVLSDSSSCSISPLTESSLRCQCSEMLESLGTAHQPTLETFQQKLVQAKARRQAKSSLLEKLSAQNSNISSQFNSMSLNELINDIHMPEFSCFINDSDFGMLENLVEEWDVYRKNAKVDFSSFEKKISGFQDEMERNKKIREYTCDMILAQITQQKQLGAYGTETMKKKGLFRKFSTLLRRNNHSPRQNNGSSSPATLSKEASPALSQLSVATFPNDNEDPNGCNQTF